MSAEPLATTPAAEAARFGVDVRRFGWIRRLAGDYSFDFPKVAGLYAGDPTSSAAWTQAIARAQRHGRAASAVAGVVAAQQARRGAPPASRRAAARLADTSTVAVVTGQQAGAFGGPLYTFLKAITAIQLGRRAAAEHGVPVVTVFWVDAEDHDWEEVQSTTVLDSGFQPRSVTVPPPDGAGELPVGALRLDERILHTLEELASTLPPTDFTPWLLSTLRAAYQPGAGMADAFARLLETVLGPHGLVVFDASDPSAKLLVADVFRRELAEPGRTAALAAEAADELVRLGHQPQVVPQPDGVSLFHLDGGRRPIRRQGDRFVTGERVWTLEELAETAATTPERFSANVLLRPIVQDTLFPTICYVAGPSELAYLGQLKGVYGWFEVPMPLIYPRATATLVDSASARFLQRYGLLLEELQPRDESALNRLLEAQLPAGIEQALREADEGVRRVMERVIEVTPSLDPTLGGAARTTLGRMEHDLRALHNKVIQAAKRRDETLRRQFTRAQAQVFPLGHPQERTLGVAFFLNRYGPALVDRLLDTLPLELGRHWLLTV